MEAGGMYRLVSLDGSLTDDDDAPELSLQLGDEDAGFERVEQHSELSELLAVLPERERTIVVLRFFDGLTQSEIAARVGISQMHVSRLLSRSLDVLRSQVAS
jgi:RNA polymerase sigma-B factor